MIFTDDTALPLPSCWEDMKGDLVKLFALTRGSQEYNNVEQELTKNRLHVNIISVCSVTNTRSRLYDCDG